MLESTVNNREYECIWDGLKYIVFEIKYDFARG